MALEYMSSCAYRDGLWLWSICHLVLVEMVYGSGVYVYYLAVLVEMGYGSVV